MSIKKPASFVMRDIPYLQHKATKLRRFPRLSCSHLCSMGIEWRTFKVVSWFKLCFVITRGYDVGTSVPILRDAL